MYLIALIASDQIDFEAGLDWKFLKKKAGFVYKVYMRSLACRLKFSFWKNVSFKLGPCC